MKTTILTALVALTANLALATPHPDNVLEARIEYKSDGIICPPNTFTQVTDGVEDQPGVHTYVCCNSANDFLASKLNPTTKNLQCVSYYDDKWKALPKPVYYQPVAGGKCKGTAAVCAKHTRACCLGAKEEG